jgi:hypothetical protein
LIDKAGMPNSSTEDGFELFPRVAPRYFKGIVLGRNLGGIKNYGAHGSSLEYPEKITEIMQQENVPLPVYDENGNLLWPKPMRYESVKKFVAERNATKKETKQNIL